MIVLPSAKQSAPHRPEACSDLGVCSAVPPEHPSTAPRGMSSLSPKEWELSKAACLRSSGVLLPHPHCPHLSTTRHSPAHSRECPRSLLTASGFAHLRLRTSAFPSFFGRQTAPRPISHASRPPRMPIHRAIEFSAPQPVLRRSGRPPRALGVASVPTSQPSSPLRFGRCAEHRLVFAFPLPRTLSPRRASSRSRSAFGRPSAFSHERPYPSARKVCIVPRANPRRPRPAALWHRRRRPAHP